MRNNQLGEGSNFKAKSCFDTDADGNYRGEAANYGENYEKMPKFSFVPFVGQLCAIAEWRPYITGSQDGSYTSNNGLKPFVFEVVAVTHHGSQYAYYGTIIRVKVVDQAFSAFHKGEELTLHLKNLRLEPVVAVTVTTVEVKPYDFSGLISRLEKELKDTSWMGGTSGERFERELRKYFKDALAPETEKEQLARHLRESQGEVARLKTMIRGLENKVSALRSDCSAEQARANANYRKLQAIRDLT